MRLSILILAHKNVTQLCRLIKKLNHPLVDIFLHLDKKFKISESELHELQTSSDRVQIIPYRYSVNIVDSSVTKCILRCTKYIIDKQCITNEAAYLALISGQDYLIKPIASLIDYLNDNYPKPFIDCTPYHPSNWVFHKFCHTPFYGKFYGSVYQKKGISGKIGRHTVRLIDSCLKKIQPDMFSRLQRYNIKLFGGSQWWILPISMVQEILDITTSHREMVDNLFNCIPDEIYFQTIGMQTSFSDKIDINPYEQVSQNSLTFAAFTAPGRNFCGHPHIMLKKDWDWLKNQPQYIARKFDMDIDNEIFDVIDNAHLNKLS